MEPKISVIVPVYNAEAYLPECVDSILAQDFRDFELILVNDGSTDGSGEICERYAEKDVRIRVIWQSNGGASKARNTGIDAANGEYIAFIDADDWVDSDYLSILLAHIKEGGLSCCEYRRKPERETINAVTRTMDKEEAMAFVLDIAAEHGVPYCKLFDRGLIVRNHLSFAEDIVYAEDFLFAIQYCAAMESNATATNQAAYYYRDTPGSVCNMRFTKRTEWNQERDLSTYEAFVRCRDYIPSGRALELCDLRTTKHAAEALRIMEINGSGGGGDGCLSENAALCRQPLPAISHLSASVKEEQDFSLSQRIVPQTGIGALESVLQTEEKQALKISVIVPVYNAEAYLPECVDSILAQDFRDFELILVNDGSTDGSGEICERYAEKDARIRVIQQSNGGASKARNAGIDAANGDYIAFVDADDWVDPDYLSILLKHMDKGGLSFCEWRRQPVRQRVDGITQIMDKEETMRFVLDLSGVHGGQVCKLFDRELILKHHLRLAEDIVYCEDILFTICYCSVSEGQISATNQDAYYYRNNPDSVCNTQFSKCAGEPPKGIFSNYEAFSRCKKYAVSENVARLCELHMVRSAVTTLRLMEINKIKCVPFGTYGELRRYVSRYCVQYLFCSSASKTSKFSLFLSTLSPKLEALVWRLYYDLKIQRLRRKNLCR